MKIRIIRTANVGGELVKPGPDAIDVPDSEARSLIALKKAVPYGAPEPSEPKAVDFNRSVGLETSETPPPSKRGRKR